MFGSEPPPHVLRVPRWLLAVHAVQIIFAIVILGLDAYGIRWIPYNALIYSLVVCLCTLGVCFYLLVSQLLVHKVYNMYVVLGLHLWMLLFWIIDLGLVANLARVWSGPNCTYSYFYGYYCSFYKRDLNTLYRRDTTTYSTYYGALTAGAVFAAVQFLLWVLSTIIHGIHWNRHRLNAASNPPQAANAPPQYATTNTQGVPLEKYSQTGVPAQIQDPQQQYAQPQPQPQPQQQQYVQPGQPQQQYYPQPGQQPQQQYSQPGQPSQQYASTYPQDPVPRQDTVSPVSQVGYPQGQPPSTVSELNTPPQNNPPYPTNASELSSQHPNPPNPDIPELASQK